MTTWTIEFYQDANGKRPVEAWMDGLGDVQIGALARSMILRKDDSQRGQNRELFVWVSAHTLVGQRSDHGQDLR